MPLSNFTRPFTPYENNPLPNDHKFRNITSIENRPVTTREFEDENNSSVDRDNILDHKIEDVQAGIITGSDNPLNAGKFVTTDGAEIPTISWVNVTDDNIEDGAISGTKITPSTIGTEQLDNGIIVPDKIPNDSIPYTKMDFNAGDIPYAVINIADGIIPGSKITGKSITQAQQGLLSVGTPELIDGSVTMPKLAGISDVPHGGTGLGTLVTPYGVVCAGTTPTGNLQNAGVGILNQIFMGNGNVLLPSWKAFNTLAASKANQIAANSTDVYTNPSVQQHHPSANKFICVFDGTLVGTNAPSFGYNVASVERISGGLYKINFTIPFTSTVFGVFITSSFKQGSPSSYLTGYYVSSTANSVTITTKDIDLIVGDSAYVSIQGGGVQ